VLSKPGKQLAKQQLIISLSITCLATIIIYLSWGLNYAISALIGGIIFIIPNVLFAYKAFKYAGARSSKKVVESFFSGVKIKLALVALLFAITFKFLVIIPLAFFGTYFLVMFITLLSPIFLNFNHGN
jgi:ATP synthase protein I